MKAQVDFSDGSLETMSWSQHISRQHFHSLGSYFGLEGYCLGLGLGLDSH